MPDIIQRIIKGEKEATREFYIKYSPKILAYLRKRLPCYEDAEEIMQDVFLEAIDSLIFFRRRSNVINWLYKIAHNKMADYYRKRKIKTILLSQIPFLQQVRNEIYEPEFQYEKNRIRDSIEKALSVLSTRYQNILDLHYNKGMKIKEIAIEFRLSFKATESLLFRARQCFIKAYERA